MTPTLWSTITSEWIKFRTVRSTVTGLVTLIVLTLGIGAIICFAIKAHWNDPGSHFDHLLFDPTSVSLGGLFLAQFAAGAIGIIAITSEYSTGSIRTTLSAVPHRTRLILAKASVLFVSLLVIGEVIVFLAFIIGQSIFRGTVPTASFAQPGVLRAVLMAGLYVALLTLLGLGIGLILRTTAFSIIVYATLLLILPIIVNFLPSSLQATIAKFLPTNLGSSMFAPLPPAQSFTWLTATLILVGYVLLVGAVGTSLLHRRDA